MEFGELKDAESKLKNKIEEDQKIAEACRCESEDNMKSAEVSFKIMSEILALEENK